MNVAFAFVGHPRANNLVVVAGARQEGVELLRHVRVPEVQLPCDWETLVRLGYVDRRCVARLPLCVSVCACLCVSGSASWFHRCAVAIDSQGSQRSTASSQHCWKGGWSWQSRSTKVSVSERLAPCEGKGGRCRVRFKSQSTANVTSVHEKLGTPAPTSTPHSRWNPNTSCTKLA